MEATIEKCEEINSGEKINSGGKFGCVVCKKQYTKKSSFDHHKLLCDFKTKSLRERQISEEELGDSPNHLELVKIIQDMYVKMVKMEEQIETMKKYIDRKKKKVNLIAWLNTNVVPTTGFREWVNMSLVVLPKHFEDLMEDTLFKVIQKVFEYNLPKISDIVYPLCSFSDKPGTIYICEKKDDGSPVWEKMTFPDTILLFRVFQNRMIQELTKWKSENRVHFDDSPKLSESFNKAVIKLMGLSFKEDAVSTRITNGLCTYLKMDLNIGVECTIET